MQLLVLLSEICLLISIFCNLFYVCDSTCNNGLETVFLNESSAVNSAIASLDSSFSSSFSTRAEYSCYFKISSGALRLAQSLNLENLTSCSTGSVIAPADVASAVSVTIPCTAGSSLQKTFVVSLIDINEFSPQFKPNIFTVSIPEDAAIGTLLIQLNRNVSDADKSNQDTFNFYILSGSEGKFKMIDGITSGIIRLHQALDFDGGQRAFTMNVSAVELAASAESSPMPLTGYATVTVNVTDADDSNPAFTHQIYTLSVNENDSSILNRELLTDPVLLASDQDFGINQTVAYAIEFGVWIGSKSSGSGSNSSSSLVADAVEYNITFLSLNSSSGQFIVTEILDREALPTDRLLLQIKAYQTDKPDTRVARALVLLKILDRNDNVPIMSAAKYTAAIAENSPAGTIVAMVTATDADLGENSTIAYRLSDTTSSLQINASNGVISVRDAARLDRESTAIINVTVWAQESESKDSYESQKSELSVQLLDTNDNSPRISSSTSAAAVQVVNVTAGSAAAGTVIASVEASDADEGAAGAVTYNEIFASPGANQLFGLASSTNASILLKQDAAASAAGIYFLAVQATDNAAAAAAMLSRSSVAILQINLLPSVTTTTMSSSATEAPMLWNLWNVTAAVTAVTQINNSHVNVQIMTTIRNKNGSSTVSTESSIAELSINNQQQLQQQIPIWLLAICAGLGVSTVVLLIALIILLQRNCRSQTPAAAAGNQQQPHLLHLNGKANPAFANSAAQPNLHHSDDHSFAGKSSDGYSPQDENLSKVMFEPAPYQSLTFSLLVPDCTQIDDVSDDAANGARAEAEAATPF